MTAHTEPAQTAAAPPVQDRITAPLPEPDSDRRGGSPGTGASPSSLGHEQAAIPVHALAEAESSPNSSSYGAFRSGLSAFIARTPPTTLPALQAATEFAAPSVLPSSTQGR
ncbi:hypothetical protein [uncultured Thermomonospora sp.]|uniref:Uncharacterized protein n=1 Tax=Thermomonospora curvata (strain ATCC 19995 / DSM 43183 / JCM 3096 / KCTC 9072 / NBRC 15933 / NCIMB 10081 / Henssen B9) TaxID=471852 RepID=D1A6C1_THECD|nr:hypothetical protein [uncultured Thermomonospora sp.]ACZ00220.1 conserved hypothetical protein [Thermomonospora curvata DSM 43183]